MLAYAWKSLGWFTAIVAVALGFLLVPLQVAAERKKLDKTVAQIGAAHRDIRALETEFDTRANLAQLEQWNGDTLRLTAPVAGQYITDEAALASLDLRGAQPGGAGAQMASLVVPSRPTGLATVQATTPAIRILPATAIAAPEPSLAGAVAEVRTAAVERIKSQAVASLDRKLLSDSTIGDLMNSARAETGGAGR
ncbi:MAG: hypothetical protein JWL96_2752 [Sphingomonas bacterium]|uniref:hypothetical protein n=1 Tax=Sphingomonas bacterium TaxID=1895847 RepID=UPI00263223E3|nr:hypothetical protein [Sphingomonas bacterium]MDB5710682.1 hypothetical protein [Sphingomonas bacterium]